MMVSTIMCMGKVGDDVQGAIRGCAVMGILAILRTSAIMGMRELTRIGWAVSVVLRRMTRTWKPEEGGTEGGGREKSCD